MRELVRLDAGHWYRLATSPPVWRPWPGVTTWWCWIPSARTTRWRVAGRLGARVYQRAFDDFAGQRNYALDQIPFKHEWVLHLDADEIVTPALHAAMRAAIADGRFDAWRIPLKMMFLGQWLRHSGLYPSYQVQLGHRVRCRSQQVPAPPPRGGRGVRRCGAWLTDIGNSPRFVLHFPKSKHIGVDRMKELNVREMRANLGRLDELVEQAGELIIARPRQCRDQQSDAHGSTITAEPPAADGGVDR